MKKDVKYLNWTINKTLSLLRSVLLVVNVNFRKSLTESAHIQGHGQGFLVVYLLIATDKSASVK